MLKHCGEVHMKARGKAQTSPLVPVLKIDVPLRSPNSKVLCWTRAEVNGLAYLQWQRHFSPAPTFSEELDSFPIHHCNTILRRSIAFLYEAQHGHSADLPDVTPETASLTNT